MTPNTTIKIFYHKEQKEYPSWYHVIIGNKGYSGSRRACLLYIEEEMKKLKEED